jgi:signal recognition particle subunit SRP54
LRSHGSLTASQVDEALREIRVSLLEADVHYRVVKVLTDRIREKAQGQEVLASLTPGQQVVKIVRDELIGILGAENKKFLFASQPPTTVMLVGLQGSGKTTTVAKLGKWLEAAGHAPILVPVDTRRPAAILQLVQLGQSCGLPVFPADAKQTPSAICKEALQEARNKGYDTLLVDTAGRLHMDEDLMAELEELKKILAPEEILFVADAMTGQDAVKSGSEFDRRLALTGIILTKLDGDARGGAALSIIHVTGKPIKFIGTGEKLDCFEPFYPDRLVSRILGMGDVLTLIEKAEQAITEKDALELQEKILQDGFTLNDFREQLKQIRKMGPLDQLVNMIPGLGGRLPVDKIQFDEKEFVRMSAILDSMTPRERGDHTIISGSRRKRIARGSGTTVQDVNRILKQFIQMKRMMKDFQKGGFMKKLAKLTGLS